MRATAEPVEGNKVKLSVELDDGEIERAVDAALRKMSRELRVPGFRPGKVPRRILEARVGVTAIRQAALSEALPDYYTQALLEAEVDAIAQPEIEVTGGQDSGPVTFDVTVEVRPKISIPGYQGLAVTIPGIAVDDAEVEAQLDRVRGQGAELVAVTRPAADGDHLTIDVVGSRHDEKIEDLSVEDMTYELGSGSIAPEVDSQLRGHTTGDILKFDARLGAQEVTLQILIKDVKEKRLPELSDAWAAEASEFDTVEALREHLRSRLGTIRREGARLALRDLVVGALVALVEDEPPDPLVAAELQRRIESFGQQIDRQGLDLAGYLSASGLTQDQLVEGLREASVLAVKADLALRAVVEAESIVATEEDIDAEIAALAERLRREPARVRAELEASQRLAEMRAEVRKAKALDWLVARVDIVDADGHPVARADLDEPDFAAEPDAEPDAAADQPPDDGPADEESDTELESRA